MPHEPTQRRHAAARRAAAVGVLRGRGRGRAEPPGLDVVRPVLGEAEDRRRGSRRRAHVHRERRRPRHPGRAQHRDVVRDVEPDHVGIVARADALELNRRVVLAGDDVGVGDDDPVARHPSGALHAEAARGPEHAHHALRRRLHLRIARDLRVRRPHARRRAADLRQRVEPRERVQDRARRGQRRVQPLEDLRLLDVARGARALRGSGAPTAPTIQASPSARHPSRSAPADAVEEPQPAADPPAQVESEHFEPGRENAADDSRADQRHERRIRRLGSLVEQQRRRPGPRAPRRRRTPRATWRRRSGPAT